MTSHCAKGKLYSLSGSNFPDKGEKILMEYPFKYNPNNPEQYDHAELVEVIWLGKETGMPYDEVEQLTGRKTKVYPGASNLYRFYKCLEPESGNRNEDPTPLEGGIRQRQKKRRSTKRTHRANRRRTTHKKSIRH